MQRDAKTISSGAFKCTTQMHRMYHSNASEVTIKLTAHKCNDFENQKRRGNILQHKIAILEKF